MQREFNPKEIALSHSRLGHFDISPLTFKTNWINRVDEATPAMIKGQLCHALMNKKNDPKLIEKYEMFEDGFDLRSNKNKERWAEAQAAGKTPMKFNDYNNAVGAAEALLKHEIAMSVFRPDEEAENEMLIQWKDKRTGLPMKGFIDRWIKRKGLIVDFKFVADASPRKYQRTFFDMNSHRQVAIYWDGLVELGLEPKLVSHVVAESEPPYNIAVYNIPADVILEGRKQYERLLDDYLTCMEKDQFDMSYEFWSPTRIHEINLPKWLKS